VSGLRIVGRRVWQVLPVLLGLTIATFALIHLVPGDPARALAGQRATPEILTSIRHQLGVDRPVAAQYGSFVVGLFRGDLGYSFLLRVPVKTLVAARLPTTVFLVVYACILAVILGVPLAVISAVKRERAPDHVLRGLLVVGLALPSFWIGVLLISFIALRTGMFPVGGAGIGFVDHLWHLFLPALTLALSFLAVLVRSLRASLIEVLDADFVALARLKGIGRMRLYNRHILRNALIPAVTILGLNLSYLLGASVVVESVFAVPGIGNTLVNAVLSRDYRLVQGIALVFGLLVILITLAVDVTQTALEPRIEAQG
jgi:peptide/nickel transport system permease protein